MTERSGRRPCARKEVTDDSSRPSFHRGGDCSQGDGCCGGSPGQPRVGFPQPTPPPGCRLGQGASISRGRGVSESRPPERALGVICASPAGPLPAFPPSSLPAFPPGQGRRGDGPLPPYRPPLRARGRPRLALPGLPLPGAPSPGSPPP